MHILNTGKEAVIEWREPQIKQILLLFGAFRVPYPSNAVTFCHYLTFFIQETTLDLYKIKGNPDLDKVFLALLDRYTNCVRKRGLPNYFMR